MMNLRHIEIFHAVYQAGSVSAAARALNVSQPSVSKVLRHAESRIGFPLFRLVKGRLVPTEEAHVLFREARDLQARIVSLQETTRNLRRGGDGFVRLAVLPSLGLDIAPAAVAALRRDHPEASFEVQTLHSEAILRSLHERSSDLALAYDPPGHPRLTAIEVGRGELVALYRRHDLPDAPARIGLDRLAHLDLIRLTGGGSIGSLFARQFEAEGQAHAAIAVQTYYVAAGLVRRGAGFAIVDEYTARACLSAELDYRPIEPATGFSVYCTHLDDRPPGPLARRFIAALQDILAEKP